MSTALRAVKNHEVIFKDVFHRDFYETYLPKCRYQDTYHKALVYCLGISGDTRCHISEIYDFNSGCVKTECLMKGWITSGSAKVIRMAFNLYCNGTPSVDDYMRHEEQLRECSAYAVDELFFCGYARYFLEAIKLRYPEYCY